MDDKPYPDIALIALKNARDHSNDLWYPETYRNRYSCCQVISENEHKNIEKNLKFFDKLEQKADSLKTIKLHVVCHGANVIPQKQFYMIAEYNPIFIQSIKTYLQELKKFMLKHKHIKLYINNDICYGARYYVIKSKDGYKMGDLFEDYKTELKDVLDRVAIAAVKGDVVYSMYPGAPNGIHEIANGMRRFDGRTVQSCVKSIAVDEKMRALYLLSTLLTYNYMRENNIKIHKKGIYRYVLGFMGHVLLPALQKASRAGNFRQYYHFNSEGKMELFDENSEKAQAMKNQFLGIKKQKPQNIETPLSLKEYGDMIFSKDDFFKSSFV